MMRHSLIKLIIVTFCFLTSCSNDEDETNTDTESPVTEVDDNGDVEDENPDIEDDDTGDNTDGDNDNEDTDDNTDGGDDNDGTDDNTDDDDDGVVTPSLTERFVFDSNIVIENSYNTSGCDSPPCDTNDESLVDVFVNEVPDDNYFSLSDDESELNLQCQSEKGRRIEFKQISRGPLTSFSQISFEAIYYDIPDNGVTIAQVHNRGGNSNKPFFRLVLRKGGLETVIRKDPEVSSGDTTFDRLRNISFVGGIDYDLSSLKIVLEKSDGFVRIKVEQKSQVILDESFEPEATTDWVNDTGIANGFYLKAGLYNDDGPHSKSLVAGYSTVIFESND